jgi:hypothetical protein
VTGQAWERHGRPPLHGSHSERFPGCANAALHDAEPPLCHQYERRPEKSSTCRAPLRLKMAYAVESRRACRPCMRAVLGHEDCLAMGSGFVYSKAWSARKRTMVNPRGFTASSLFLTVSRKT